MYIPAYMCDVIRAMCPETIRVVTKVWSPGEPSEGLPSSCRVCMGWGLWKGPKSVEQVQATWLDGLDRG